MCDCFAIGPTTLGNMVVGDLARFLDGEADVECVQEYAGTRWNPPHETHSIPPVKNPARPGQQRFTKRYPGPNGRFISVFKVERTGQNSIKVEKKVLRMGTTNVVRGTKFVGVFYF